VSEKSGLLFDQAYSACVEQYFSLLADDRW
jgi:hypothetical protein